MIFSYKKISPILLLAILLSCVAAQRMLDLRAVSNGIHHFSADCTNNLNWIGRSAEDFRSKNGTYASSLDDLGAFVGWEDAPKCSLGNDNYSYKPDEHGFELYCPVAQDLLDSGHSGRLYVYRSGEGLSLKQERK